MQRDCDWGGFKNAKSLKKGQYKPPYMLLNFNHKNARKYKYYLVIIEKK